MAITNDEIQEVQQKLGEKYTSLKEQIEPIREAIDSLDGIKMSGRKVVDRPAEYRDEPDGPGKVLVRAATYKTVYDIPPKSRDDPESDLSEPLREKRLAAARNLL